MSTYVERLKGAARLDVGIYEEVEADTSATGQAMLTVILSSLAAGIGGAASAGLGKAIGATVGALVAWAVWAWITWLVGTRLLPQPQTQADVGQLLRTIGFSAAPGFFRALGIVPIIGPFLAVLAGLWMFAAMVVAVRQALDYDNTLRALAVCFVGALFYLLVGLVVGSILGLGRFLVSG